MARYKIGATVEVVVEVEASNSDEALKIAREIKVKGWEVDCHYPSFLEILDGPEEEDGID